MSELVWTEEAEEKVKRAPIFVRGMVKKRVEKEAVKEEITEITADFVAKVQEKFMS